MKAFRRMSPARGVAFASGVAVALFVLAGSVATVLYTASARSYERQASAHEARVAVDDAIGSVWRMYAAGTSFADNPLPESDEELKAADLEFKRSLAAYQPQGATERRLYDDARRRAARFLSSVENSTDSAFAIDQHRSVDGKHYTLDG